MSEANRSATTVGIVDWKTIAPVMLPIARVSLSWRTQMIELNFSGSSVAIGAMTSARMAGSTLSCVARSVTASTKNAAPTMMKPSAVMTCTLTTRRRGTPGSVAMGRPVDPMEPQRRELRRMLGRLLLEVAADVPGVDRDQDCGHDPLEPDRVERQEGSPDRQGIGDPEVAHVVGEDARVDQHRVAARAPAGSPQDRDPGHEHGQRREHERGAQDRADPDLVG